VADESSLKTRVIIAGWIEGVRLIDNMAMQNSLVGA
jgi:pantothenate synthetase